MRSSVNWGQSRPAQLAEKRRGQEYQLSGKALGLVIGEPVVLQGIIDENDNLGTPGWVWSEDNLILLYFHENSQDLLLGAGF